MKNILIVSLVIFISAIPLVHAHPIIDDSIPEQSTNVGAGLTQITINFSEAVELDFSNIKVFDNTGKQIDNKDTSYVQEDGSSLFVTTPPLQDGVYTVTTKVLSRVDGHLVDYAFVFGIGDVTLPPPPQISIEQAIYFPEAGARFPGIVGQVIVLGTAISYLAIWRGIQKKTTIRENHDLQKLFHTKLSIVTGIALFTVFASNILMLAVQTIRLQVSASELLQTSFGSVWIVRMGLTVVLLAVWFLLENRSSTTKKQILILGLSLVLIGTTTVIGHGAASEQFAAVVIDYIHNLIASVWIGGVIFFGFILIPAFSKISDNKKDLTSLMVIPKFSSMIIVSLGIVIITGPTLLWLLEDDIGLLSESYYGLMIISKITIGMAMVMFGGYNQFRIQKIADRSLGVNSAYKKLKRSLRAEAALGIILLGIVALLTNSSLPSSQAEMTQVPDGFDATVFSENIRFSIKIDPLKSGTNTIFVSAFDQGHKLLDDISEVKVKISNSQNNIPPIEIPLSKTDGTEEYKGTVTFGFSGKWDVEINAKRKNHPNENTNFAVFVKPRLSELRTEIIEYPLPENASPLYLAHDGNDTIWISDASQPKLWKYSISQGQFTRYQFEGKTSIVLKIDGNKVWLTDTPDGKIEYFDMTTEQFHLVSLPIKSIPISLETDLDGNLWIALIDRHMLLKYDPITGKFEEHEIPTSPAGPVALTRDSNGDIWFAESQGGKIGVINPRNGDIREFMPQEPLKEPFFLYLDQDENILISEHTGLRVMKFDPYLETFAPDVTVVDPNAAPFALSSDKFGNTWIAQHTVDKLGVYDPQKDEFVEINIPTQPSWVQFLTSDKNGDIWFAAQRANKLGHVNISESPQINTTKQANFDIQYSEFVFPLVSAGIVATSLFFVKSIRDKRRLDSLID